jgi:methionyl-tRNA synthetase
MNKPFYITTPIYYVNDNPHIGHAYTTVNADVVARYHRIAGEDVFFLTGTDEHGQKVAEAAKAKGITPKQHCDLYVRNFQKFWKELGIENDHFIRTTDEYHEKAVQRALETLWEKGDIYADEYSGWYCTPCERFWTEKDLAEGNCPDCGRPVEFLTEKNYFFRMSNYREWLIDHIERNPNFIQPDSRRNEILGFLRGGLNDLCISRPKERLSWGIEFPFDKDYVCYVWFDALLNYATAPGWPHNMPRFEHIWPADFHLIGKDIVTTHAVYWPTMLKALDIEPPKCVFSHGWWMVETAKMGKSLGNAVPIPKLVGMFGRDALRYFLVREKVFALDAQFSFEAMISRLNTDLANDLGNLASRILTLIQQNFRGLIPPSGTAGEDEIQLRDIALETAEAVKREVWEMRPSKALEAANELVRETNRYLERTAPWTLAKDSNYERLETVLYNAAEALRVISILYWPVMPDTCDELRARLGLKNMPVRFDRAFEWGELMPETIIEVGKPLFPRIDEKAAIQKLNDKDEELVDISEFAKIDIRVAEILECSPAPNADKLLLLKVDIGGEIRPLVAGIAKSYAPEELIGKKIVMLANLKPAKIRGHESQGMILAAESDGVIRVLTPDGDLPAGSKVR